MVRSIVSSVVTAAPLVTPRRPDLHVRYDITLEPYRNVDACIVIMLVIIVIDHDIISDTVTVQPAPVMSVGWAINRIRG